MPAPFDPSQSGYPEPSPGAITKYLDSVFIRVKDGIDVVRQASHDEVTHGKLDSLEAAINDINFDTAGLSTDAKLETLRLLLEAIEENTDTLELKLTDLDINTDGIEASLTSMFAELAEKLEAGDITGLSTVSEQQTQTSRLVEIRDYLDTAETKLQSLIENTDSLEVNTDSLEALQQATTDAINAAESARDTDAGSALSRLISIKDATEALNTAQQLGGVTHQQLEDLKTAIADLETTFNGEDFASETTLNSLKTSVDNAETSRDSDATNLQAKVDTLSTEAKQTETIAKLEERLRREDSYNSMEPLEDQAGADGVLTFTFSSEMNLIWIRSIGGISRASDSNFTPTETLGIYCADDEPCPVTLNSDTIKIYSPSGAVVSVWGYQYA